MKATLYTDGGARGNPGPAGIGYVLSVEEQEPLEHGEYIGEATNNQAEYRALLAGLERASDEGVDELTVLMDSELIVKQMRGEYRVRDGGLKPLYAEGQKLVTHFTAVEFEHVKREKNKRADALVNKALDEHL